MFFTFLARKTLWVKLFSLNVCEAALQAALLEGGNYGAKLTHLCDFWLDVSFFSHVKKHRSRFWSDVSFFSRVKTIVRSSDWLELELAYENLWHSFLVSISQYVSNKSDYFTLPAKFLDDNKPKTSLKKWIRTTSSMVLTFIKFVKCWRNCLGFNPERPYLRRRRRKEKICSPTPFLTQLWNFTKKSVMHVQSCCFANVNLLLFFSRVAVAVVVVQTPSRWDQGILLPWWRDGTLLLFIVW